MLHALAQGVLEDLRVEGCGVTLEDVFLSLFYLFGVALDVAAIFAATFRTARLASGETLAVKLEASRLGATAFLDSLLVLGSPRSGRDNFEV